MATSRCSFVIARAIHLAHAAGADRTGDLVRTQTGALLQWHLG